MGRTGIVCLLIAKEYKADDPCPDGYLDRYEWYRAQRRAGLRQTKCMCGVWLFPQEWDTHTCEAAAKGETR